MNCIVDERQIETCYRNDELALRFTVAETRTKEITLKFCSDRLFYAEFIPENSDLGIDRIAKAFAVKYGPPEESSAETKQNRFGAKFTRKFWAWAFGAKPVAGGTMYESVITLENMTEALLKPSLTIMSPKTMAECESAGINWGSQTAPSDDL